MIHNFVRLVTYNCPFKIHATDEWRVHTDHPEAEEYRSNDEDLEGMDGYGDTLLLLGGPWMVLRMVEVRDGIAGDGLTLTVIPGDSGKPTARLEKAKVKDGCCSNGFFDIWYQFLGLQDQREVDGSENVNVYNKILTTKLSNSDKEGSLRSDPSERAQGQTCCQAELSDMELQTLRKQIVKESKKGQDLSKEAASLKEERNKLKEEFEKMKVKVNVNSYLSNEAGDPWDLVDELKQELNYEKDLNTNLRLQLQKTQESNAELILAVQDQDEMLKQKQK
nr:myosin heavy chain-related protein [Tanacetum cinerariifolium]